MAEESVKESRGSVAPGSLQRERRSTRRCKITQILRARPSDPELEHFDDIRGTASVSRSGVYFHSILGSYTLGMRLFVSLPYSREPTMISREYLAEVVRVDPQPGGKVGVGLKLLMEIGFRESFVETAGPRRR